MLYVIPAFDLASRGMKCSICHCNQRPLYKGDLSGPHERIVRTGINIDFEGEFDICESCITEMGKLVGLGPDDALLDARVANMDLRRELEETQQSLEAMKLALTTLSQELADTAKRKARQTLAEVKELAEEPDFS
jgi:hypothetical protein